MDAQLSGDATRRTRETEEKGGQNLVRQRPLTLGQQRVSEIVKGTPTAVAPVALQSWPIVVYAPGTDIVALASRTVQGAIFPPQCMDIGVAGVSVEELVEV